MTASEFVATVSEIKDALLARVGDVAVLAGNGGIESTPPGEGEVAQDPPALAVLLDKIAGIQSQADELAALVAEGVS